MKTFYLPILFLLFGLVMGELTDVRSIYNEVISLMLILPSIGSTYWQCQDSLMVMSVYCIISCSTAIFLGSIVMDLLLQPLQVFAVEHQDGVSKAIDIVLHVFIRVSAISVFPVTISLVITYLFVTTTKYVWTDFLLVLLVQLLIGQTWIAVFILAVCCKPSVSHRICPLIAALAGFTSGFIVAPRNMPIYYRWMFPINPIYWGYAATVKILLENTKFDCEYDSQLECYPYSGLYVLESFGFNDANPYLSLVSLISILIVCLSLATFVLEIVHTPHAMKNLFQPVFRLTQARYVSKTYLCLLKVFNDFFYYRSGIYKWPSGTTDKHTTLTSWKSSDKELNLVSYMQPTTASQSQQNTTESALLGEIFKDREGKDNQSITDRPYDTSPEVQQDIPKQIPQPSPEVGLTPTHQTNTISGDVRIHGPLHRATRTKYILAERNEKMQESASSVLAILFCTKQWNTNALQEQRARKNILESTCNANWPLKHHPSIRRIKSGSFSHYYNVHKLSIQLHSVKPKTKTVVTSGKAPDGSLYSWSSRNHDKPHIKEERQSPVSRFAGKHKGSSFRPPLVHLPPLRLKRRYSSLPDTHQLDGLG
jgi:hypothetical protein